MGGIHMISNNDKLFKLHIIIPVGLIHDNETVHLLEHMLLFQNKKYRRKIFLKEVESIGCYYNGYTEVDRTIYIISSHKDHYEKSIDLLYNVVCNPYIVGDKYLENEKKAVIEELNIRRQTPETALFDKMTEMVTGIKISSDSDIANLDVQTLKRVYKKYYDPLNFTIVCNCDTSIFKKVRSKLRNLFPRTNKLSPTNEPSFKLTHTFPYGKNIRVTGVDLHQLYFVFPFYNFIDMEKICKFKLLEFFMRKKFEQILRQDLGLVYYVSSSTTYSWDFGYFYISMSSNLNAQKRIIGIFKTVIEKMKKYGFGKGFERTKVSWANTLKYQYLRINAKTELIGNMAFFGNEDFDILKTIESTSEKDVLEISREILNIDKMLIIRS